MSETDRIVIVASGFGLWLAGQHVASARWGDVARVRAMRSAADAAAPITVEIALADGRTIALHEHVSGWRSFLRAAPAQLAGMPATDQWRAELASSGGEVVLFDRSARRR